MDLISILGIGIVAALLSVILKQYKPEMGMAVSLVTGIAILLAAISVIKPVISTITQLVDIAELDKSYASVLIKALAICYITQLSSDCCKDAGESAIATKLQFAGKIAVIVVAMPMFTSLSNIVISLLNT